MKLRAGETIIVVMALVIVLLSWGLIYYSRDELGTQAQRREEQIKTASGARLEDGRPVVHLPVQSQAAAGIVVEPLRTATRESAFDAYGIVLNLQPLAELRGRYLAAAAEARAATATLDLAESEARRMEALYRDDRNVSEQAMQAAQARLRAERSRRGAADQLAAGMRETMRGAWGEAVTAWAVNPDSPMMRSLLEQKAFLVQLVLPHDLPRGAVHGRISVAPAMAREHARSARFVADSPQIDPALPGETYFYLVDGGGFRAGMRVAARIKLQGAALTGVVVPAAAVVWHAGKAWAYVKQDDERFARYEVSTADEFGGGWFNATGFDEDDEVVVSGAQLLLSEELKYQIRNENED
ncbi:MAG TPA: hypothetical protein VJ862_10435 [Rhodanobacteraceae bacterium]|nr:hypothetical protein [Rhodanobacteraceae bacterium]